MEHVTTSAVFEGFHEQQQCANWQRTSSETLLVDGRAEVPGIAMTGAIQGGSNIHADHDGRRTDPPHLHVGATSLNGTSQSTHYGISDAPTWHQVPEPDEANEYPSPMSRNDQDSELRNSQEPTAPTESEFYPLQDITEQLHIVDERKRTNLIQLGDEETARRRKLAALRQRRFRERQRTLLGLPEQRKRRIDVSNNYGEAVMQLEAAQDKPVHVPRSEHAQYSRTPSTGIENHLNVNATLAGIQENSARKDVAHRLCDQLLHGFRGCTEEQHEKRSEEHAEAVGNNHNDLSEIFNDSTFPSVLGLPSFVQKDSLMNHKTHNSKQWNTMFCGASQSSSDGIDVVKNVCLHKEETRVGNPEVSFDVDSFLGFATSLGVARNGLLYQPSPQARQNVSSDVHFGLHVNDPMPCPERQTKSSFAMLRDVPHFFLGRLESAENVTLHVFLPHLEVAQGSSVLSKEQLTRWNDKILHPAIYKNCPAHFTQHLPTGHPHALANSRARQVEARKIDSASYQSQQAIIYCQSIWTRYGRTF